MRKNMLSGLSALFLSAILFFIVSCSKEISATKSTAPTSSPTTSSTSSTIGVALDSAGTDSVYLIQPCDHGYFRDSIASSALPDSILNYLTANYPGYGFQKAFVIKDSSGNVGGYVVVINFDGKPVGLLFDASGKFQRILEQREGCDVEGTGWHAGGRFCNRDGLHRDTLALSALPTAISTYMSTNYPSDTLIRAFQNQDSSILVISGNNGLFATLFNSSGVFIKRVSIAPPVDLVNSQVVQNIAQDSLPSNGLNFLSTTFPNYVFESALSFTVNGQNHGYAVVIDANNTKYAVWLDSAGNLVAILPIW